jgi:toxin ParE1/3/4
MQLVVLPAARLDLARIWTDTSVRWGSEQADTYVASLSSRFDNITDFPLSYPEYHSRLGVFRKAGSGHHMIFYRQIGDMIEIVRVLHERMDFDSALT